MNSLLAELVADLSLSGTIRDDMTAFLVHHGFAETVGHSMRVAAEAKRIAGVFAADETAAEVAGWLHDISAVFPNPQRAQIARELGVEVLPEEDNFPMIVHQKLSVVIAREIFGVRNRDTLSAIGCHTTLKGGSSILDKVVFVADKIKCDQPGEPPYLQEILDALQLSLDRAAFCYLDFLWQNREHLAGPIHPWVIEAHGELARELDNG